MAAPTTNADLATYDVLTAVEIKRLGTAALDGETPPWKTRHDEAWAKTLQRLRVRNPSIEESSVDDPTELSRACAYYVAYLGFRQQAGSPQDLKRAAWYYDLWEREVEEVYLTIFGQETAAGGWGWRRAMRT